MENTSINSEAAVPVTIITGFLGAGKTTLLNELIGRYPQKRFAIIENEFGEIPIDQELVVAVEDGIFELSNGCICCTLNEDLAKTLVKLINRKADFDHLLIETTGIAEPDGVAAVFLNYPELQEHFRLDGTICIADATMSPEILLGEEEAKRQLSFADAILLNKRSDADPQTIQELEAIIASFNPFADVFPCDFGKTEVDLLNMHAYSEGRLSERLDRQKLRGHHHHAPLTSYSFTFEEPLDLLRIRHWINVLLMVQHAQIYRIKGILHIQDQPARCLLQSVRQSHVFTYGKDWEAGETKCSRIVFIGKQIEEKMLDRALRSCVYKNPFPA